MDLSAPDPIASASTRLAGQLIVLTAPESLGMITRWPAARSVCAYSSRSSSVSFTNRTDGVRKSRVAIHPVRMIGHEGSVMHRTLSTKSSELTQRFDRRLRAAHRRRPWYELLIAAHSL